MATTPRPSMTRTGAVLADAVAAASLKTPARRPAAELVAEWWSEAQGSAPARTQLDFAIHAERLLPKLVEALDGPAAS